MRSGLKARTAIMIGMMLLGISSSAKAGVVLLNGSGAWRFFGNCQDCAIGGRPVTATLTLQNYIQGTALANANFVSFVYDGSNLLLPYSVPSAGLAFVSLTGNLTDGGSESVFLRFGFGGFFDMIPDRRWATCGVGCFNDNDNGNAGNFVLGAQTVPEPASYALMALGLAGVAVVSRRRQRRR